MSLFVQHNPSAGIETVDFLAKAGYSAQTPRTAGFIPLYAETFTSLGEEQGGWNLPRHTEVACTDAYTRFSFSAAPALLEEALRKLAGCAVTPVFKEKDLAAAIAEFKNHGKDYSSTPTALLNQAVESRVLYPSPWKTASGADYRAISQMNVAAARAILIEIQKTLYVPDNCAFFFSGSVEPQAVLALVQEHFGQWRGRRTEEAVPGRAENPFGTNKKFVVHDAGLSADFTQVMIQYSTRNLLTAQVLALFLNQAEGTMVRSLLEQKNDIGLREADYVNAGAVADGNGGRLIVQGLFESGRRNPVDVQERLASIVVSAMAELESQEASPYVQEAAAYILRQQERPSRTFRQMLLAAEEKWAASTDFSADTDLHLAAASDQEPFVFVFVNSGAYKKYRKEFEGAAFSAVTHDSAPWYAMKEYSAAARQLVAGQGSAPAKKKAQDANQTEMDFATSNVLSVSRFALGNEIPVAVKSEPHSPTVALSVGIAGGERHSPDDCRQLETILMHILAHNISDAIYRAQMEGAIAGEPEVYTRTEDYFSFVELECSPDDFDAVARAFIEAVVYGEFEPALMDDILFDQRSQWASKKMALWFQMESAAHSEMYGNSARKKLYDIDAPILQNLTYERIVASYPELLDCRRYSLAVAGNTSQLDIKAILQDTFGVLRQLGVYYTDTNQSGWRQEVQEFTLPSAVRELKLNHVFGSDIPAEKAGPRPLHLIPTKDFADPVIFYFAAPQDNAERQVFNAILYDLCERLQNKSARDVVVSVRAADAFFPFAKVQFSKTMDSVATMRLYTATVQEIQAAYSSAGRDMAISHASALWAAETFSRTGSSAGSARLVHAGLIQNEAQKAYYDYIVLLSASADDFTHVAAAWFEGRPQFRVYSKESK